MSVVLLLFFSLFSFCDLAADTRGSESLVSVQSFFTFPENPGILAGDNIMLGFGWFKNGFALQNSATECTFNDVFPVSGTVNLNGGTLILSQDLLFKNVVDLQGWGVIQGNSHSIELCSSITQLPSNADSFDNTTIYLNADLTITSTLTFKNDCTIVGNGNTLFLDQNGGMYIDSNATLALRDIVIKDISSGNILCADNTGQLILDSVKWYQNGDYTFDIGSILFVDSVEFYGDNVFVYDSAYTSTISSGALWHIFDDMVFCIGRKTADGAEPIYFEDNNAAIRFSNCRLHINQNGILFTRGSLIFDALVELDDDSTSTLNGMIIGNGIALDDPTMEFDAGATVLLKSSNLVFDTASSHALKTGAHKGARLKRSLGSNIYLKKDLTLPSMSLEADSVMILPIMLGENVLLEYDDTLIILPDAEFDITSARRDTYTYLLNGGDSIFLTKGVLPFNIKVEGAENRINGNGSISGIVTLTDENTDLSFELQGFVGGAIELNNGTLILNNNLSMGTDSILSGSGTINLNDKALHLPFIDFDWTSTIAFIGSNASVDLHSQVSLKSTVTISGTVILDGNGNVFDISDAGNLYVSEESTLILKDLYIKGLSDDMIICAADSSQIIVDNSFINLVSDCTFSKGSLLFRNNVNIVGSHIFTYESSQTSTIDSNSRVHITDDVQFVIGKHPISKAESLYFVDKTSVLNIDNGFLQVTNQGAHLYNGLIICDNDVAMEILGTSTEFGLELGNGEVDDTTQIILNAGTTLRTLGGSVVYNIGNPHGFVSHSRSAQIVRSPLSETFLKTSINFSDLTVRLLDTPMLSTPTPQDLVYSNVGIDLPTAEFILTGQRYTNSSNILRGNDSIFMVRGIYALGTVVMGTNNIIRGNGSIGGPIIYLSPTAKIDWALSGQLIGDMTLNGGTVKLSSDMHLARGTRVKNGKIELQSHSLVFGSKDITISQNNYFDGSSGSVILHSDLTLDAVWTFSNDCVLDGNGNEFTLGASGKIIVEAGSKLRIRNLNLKNIAGNNICCVDDASMLELDSVQWLQSDNFIHDKGSLDYYNKIVMRGDKPVKFVYQSIKESTIRSNSRLQLDSKVTFSYDPIYSDSKDLLVFEDDTAELNLRSATLHSTVVGMNLKSGILSIQGDTKCAVETIDLDPEVIIDEGIILGDNQTSDNDMQIIIDAGATLKLTHGSIRFKNVQNDSIILVNAISTLELQKDTTLYVDNSLVMPLGRVFASKDAEIKIAAGKVLDADIIITS